MRKSVTRFLLVHVVDGVRLVPLQSFVQSSRCLLAGLQLAGPESNLTTTPRCGRVLLASWEQPKLLVKPISNSHCQ